MISDSKNINENAGKINPAGDSSENSGEDEKFRASVKSLLLLIKDFYAADYTVVYWYNKTKNSFKLLSDSEIPASGIHKEKFVIDSSGDAGNDILSAVCVRQEPKILDDTSVSDSIIHVDTDRVKSLIASPLIADNDVIGVVVCESKFESFFGLPNIDTLKIFSDCISSYIQYYSLKEEFDFEDSLLKAIASGKFGEDDFYGIIISTLERFIKSETMFVVVCNDELIIRSKLIKKYESGFDAEEIDIEEGSLLHTAIKDRKVFNRYYRFGGNDTVRYSRNEEKDVNVNFCAVPFTSGQRCIGVLAFDTRDEINVIQSSLKNLYKLLYPVFLFLNNSGKKGTLRIEKENKDKRKGKSEFNARLKSELARSRQFDEYNLFVVETGIDFIETLLKTGYTSGELEQLIIDDLNEELNCYDQIYKSCDNRYLILLCSDSEDRVHIEFEKIRKNISVKIHFIEGKEVTFTVSFAIKRYLDLNVKQDDFLEELEDMLKLSGTEGGNLVKI